MNIAQLKNKIIEEGIEGVENDSKMKESCKEGSIEGFKMCREIDVKTPDNFEKLIKKQEEEGVKEFRMAYEKIISTEDYWKFRHRTVQIEYVYEILKFGWIEMGFEFSTLSANAGMTYHKLIQKYSIQINN